MTEREPETEFSGDEYTGERLYRPGRDLIPADERRWADRAEDRDAARFYGES